MSAETLRRAAALMRERSEAAADGPWESLALGSEGYAVLAERPAKDRRRSRLRVARLGWEDWDTDKADAEHIASWHPDVALAVADWLDVTAADMDENTILDSPESGEYMPPNPEALWCDYCGGAIESPHYAADDQRCKCDRWHKALTVARAYLGEA